MMNSTLIRTFLAVAMALVPFGAFAAAALAPCQPGELLVLYHADAISIANTPQFAAFLTGHGLKLERPLTRRAGSGAVRYVTDDPSFDPVAAARELTDTGLVRAASPNYRLRLFLLPNDPVLPLQWYIQDYAGADIGLPAAWDVTTGDPNVVIAILDTGLDWSHPDLQAAVWTNPGEIDGNGVDDDGNGWIDDMHGWDVGNDDADVRPDVYLEEGIDVGFHGTHCAGIAAAATDNGVGIAGAAWGCRLMGLKCTGATEAFTTAGMTEAFDYAVANGASVISMSFGGYLEDFGYMQALVDDANAAGVVCVAAAGNEGNSTPIYPAVLDGVIAVGATDDANQRASFSSFGSWVDLAAPGQLIWSTVQSNYEWDLLTQLLYMLSFGWDGVSPYMYCDGTSMACPLVAGVCGLVRSLRPDYTPAEVAQLLAATGDTIAYDQPIGVKVNAGAALEALLLSAVPNGPDGFHVTDAYPNPFNPTTTIVFELERETSVDLRVYDVSGRLVRVLVAGRRFGPGRQEVTWRGRDANDRPVAAGVYFYRFRAGDLAITKSVTLIK